MRIGPNTMNFPKIKITKWRMVGLIFLIIILWQVLKRYMTQITDLFNVFIIISLLLWGLWALWIFLFDPQTPKERTL